MNKKLAYFEQENCKSVCATEFDDEQSVCNYIKRRLQLNGDESVLVLGCGKGTKEKSIFSEDFLGTITLVDISNNLLQQAKDNNPSAKIVKMDLSRFYTNKFKEKYDIIYSYAVMQYLEEKHIKRLNDELLKIIKTHGRIIHFDIPDKRRKWIYKINRSIVQNNLKYLVTKYDFIDAFSHWISPNVFKGISGTKVTFDTPSYDWERFDVMIQRNKTDD